MLKTHGCGTLRAAHAGESVVLAGWVHRRRDHGQLVFIDLRDRDGIVQVVVRPDDYPEAYATANDVRGEYVLRVAGEVVKRSEATRNPNLDTGDIEVVATSVEVLNSAKTPPFSISEEDEVNELVRLQYRYIDLRRPAMIAALELRHRLNQYIRDFMTEQGFLEVETPILVAATPEGARDYVVPSRLTPGAFYALPQAPQQFKQLLMVAGVERYFQIARCFRDEDLRADRQPEFVQLDLEWSFCEEEDILGLLEELFAGLAAALRPDLTVPRPFPRLTWHEAMERYGSDKPDLRYGLELSDCSDIAATSGFGVFSSTIANGGRVRGIVMPGGASLSRREVDGFTALAKTMGAPGLVSLQFSAEPAEATEDDVRSPVLRHLGIEDARRIGERCGASAGDLVLLAAGDSGMVSTVLDGIRRELARRLDLVDDSILNFGFVTDFPLVEWDAEGQRWDALHHPFTAPQSEDIDMLDSDPANVRARAYDTICNGFELGSGSIRIHERDLQMTVFELLGVGAEEAQQRFGHMLNAFEYGAPPHGGFAFGIDRVAMLLAGTENIREVIAFPKTMSASDPMTGAPMSITLEQLDELHLQVSEAATPAAQ
ncbi:MAG: aspartate--tRNA ligase [Chloroflexi bacterium]|nr:aspartate--tRNA ligase [Chloroflexota bacterium]MCY3587628.1 aspartate--tRNA ligase [Chloroflexota bacterium]MCY3686409.1 aspartate--tRNA ligase [Chloroflexota bacterium]MDE2708133.1 aspartate--tRNA ligase [Chloroflexota bacterium]